MSDDYRCECGHDGEEHTPEDDGDGFINCRYECNVTGCACEIFRYVVPAPKPA